MNNIISDILRKEQSRQSENIELIASENFTSLSVRELCGSVFTNKYAEGYPGNRYYNGCENMDDIEILAMELLKTLFDINYCNVQPHSGANANTAVYQAFLKPSDRILGMDLSSGGHLSHGAKVNLSGKFYESSFYGVNNEGWLDYDQIRDVAKKIQPKMIVAGASAYPRVIDFKIFREIADEVGAYLLADVSHYSGLIVANEYPNPSKYADVITSTTHKTLRGPRGGVIMWNNNDYTKKINSAIFPGTQGGPLMNIVAAKAQCFFEAHSEGFKEYASNVIKNARVMSDVFTSEGINVVTGGTDSHIILLDLSSTGKSGKEVADELEFNNITVNKNSIPNDKRSFIQTSGIRLGTAAETTRGKTVNDFKNLSQDIARIIKS